MATSPQGISVYVLIRPYGRKNIYVAERRLPEPVFSPLTIDNPTALVVGLSSLSDHKVGDLMIWFILIAVTIAGVVMLNDIP